MLRASMRMVTSPSLSCSTSSAVVPWTLFQYRELTTGICEMVKNLLMSSNDAVVPARRALSTAAAGLWANTFGRPARPLA